MARGDHIRVSRILYSHHGIDLGDGTVVHFTGEPGKKSDAETRRTSLDEFLCGGHIEVISYSQSKIPDHVVETALSFIGIKGYNLLFNNCEHFARYCKTGDFKSEQVEAVSVTAGGSVATTAGVYMGIAGLRLQAQWQD